MVNLFADDVVVDVEKHEGRTPQEMLPAGSGSSSVMQVLHHKASGRT